MAPTKKPRCEMGDVNEQMGMEEAFVSPPMKKRKVSRKAAMFLTLLGMAVLLWFEVGKPILSEDETLQRLYTMVITRGV